MKMLNDSLIKENHSKDREIRKLNKDMQHCEQTVMSLRNELSNNNSYHTSEVPKKDAEVTADICCSGSQECGDVEPVRESALCSARLRRLDVNVKSSGDSVRSLRQLNVSLSEEVRALQRVCGALDEQCRAAGLRARFKDDVIHEMRRQLRQAKAKLKELSESNIPKNQEHDVGPKTASYDSLTISCVQRPRRKHARALELDCDCRSPVYDESDDDHVIVTSTPNTSGKFDKVAICTGDESFVERSPSPPLELSDSCLSACSDASLAAACDCSDRLTGDDRALPATETSSPVDRKINLESQIIGENLQDSTGASGSEFEARARSLEDSLLAAARALKNKEETVRVQAESLALAEERLAAASRARFCATGSHLDVTDVSATTTLPDNREIVKTLQDNLSVIEDLYRECFYEDVALQVENLKAEISNFLNNSTNNDSGVWEAGGGGAVEEQLRRLWAVLQVDCMCGMTEENMKLKKTNETMKIQIQNLQQRVSDLQEALENKENLGQQYQRQIEEKEEKLQHIKDQLSELERDSRDQRTACSKRACEVKQLEGLLTDKTEELINVQHQCVSQETIITKLRDELEKANTIAQENASVRREVWLLSAKVEAWRRQLAEDARPRAEEHRRHLEQHYAEKCTQAEELRGELRRARAGGAALCVRARAALHAARDGLRALADHARENEEIISRQELLIRSLREKSSKNISKTSSVSDNDPCCSRYLHRLEIRSDDRSFIGAREVPRSKCASSGSKARTGESEKADGPPPPAPPRRLLRKKPLCVNRRCQSPQVREASVCCTPSESPMSSIVNREFSADSLLERVERTHEALELAHRRWCRHEHEHDLPSRETAQTELT